MLPKLFPKKVVTAKIMAANFKGRARPVEQLEKLRDDLITAFKIFKGLLDIDSNLFFLPLDAA